MAYYAYVRVSTREQNIDRQLVALEPYCIPKKNIYCDYQSGRDFDRPAYQKLLKRLKSGDCLIVKSIDRLGRNYKELSINYLCITCWEYCVIPVSAELISNNIYTFKFLVRDF